MICPTCGHGEIVPTQAVGRRWPHKTIPDLELPPEVSIPTCNECGDEWIDDIAGKEITEAAEKAYRKALLEKAENAIRTLRAAPYPQRMIENLLGLSAGYLSKLRAADRDPSPHLVAALMLLADSPDLVEELRSLWAMQRPEFPWFQRHFGSGTVKNQGKGQQLAAKAALFEVKVA